METNNTKAVSFNKNDKQSNFNRVRGIITELNEAPEWCSITLSVGHENKRYTNFCMKAELYKELQGKYKIGDKVNIGYFINSRFKYDRWHTTAYIIEIALDN